MDRIERLDCLKMGSREQTGLAEESAYLGGLLLGLLRLWHLEARGFPLVEELTCLLLVLV